MTTRLLAVWGASENRIGESLTALSLQEEEEEVEVEGVGAEESSHATSDSAASSENSVLMSTNRTNKETIDLPSGPSVALKPS